MSISSWICTNSSKTQFLRIVHPGGSTELHDRPVLAAEIMHRNPRCCIAYPHVFQQPWAIVAPNTMLMPGQKFYVVPLSTVRKLQRLSPKRYHSPFHETRSVQFSDEEDDDVTTKVKPDDLAKETGFCDNNPLARKRKQDLTGNSTGGSPRRLSSSTIWQPRLESITEE